MGDRIGLLIVHNISGMSTRVVVLLLAVLTPVLSFSLKNHLHRHFFQYGSMTRIKSSADTGIEVENSTTALVEVQALDSKEVEREGLSIEARKEVEWRAYKKSSVVVKEKERSVEDYMALPSTEYSVLASDSIERLDDKNFKAMLPTMNFFGTKITPVLYVDVTVYPDEARSVIAVQRAETVGSEIAEKINGTFDIEAINEVSAGKNDKNEKTLNSETNLKINVVVPSSSKIPMGVMRRTGNFLMQSSLNVIVPTFVRLLAFDFKNWSGGDDGRSAIEGASFEAGDEMRVTQEDD